MNQFITYIEDTLHITVNASVYENLDTLPLYLRNGYELYKFTIQNVSCLLARPKEQSNLTVLRKQSNQIKKITGLDCVLCLENIRIYTKEKMLSDGIPFVIAGMQIYMPFLGVALSKNAVVREFPHKENISFSTQRLLLTAIYEDWKQITLTEAAKVLGISKMSVTRCFDELQALNILLIKSERKTRRFIWEGGRRALWETVLPFLRNPVAQQYRFGEKIEIETGRLKKSGFSALCHYSILADNSYTVYAVSRDSAKTLELSKLPVIPNSELPEMVVQIMRYDIKYKDCAAIDPLTAIISLTDEEKNDPRVEAAIKEILEECLND